MKIRLLFVALLLLVWVPPAWAAHPSECNAGPFAVPGLSDDPDEIGEWGTLVVWPEIAVHATLLHTGNVLWWYGIGLGGSPTTATTYVWNRSTGLQTTYLNSATDLFCSGHSILADGRVIAIGGTEDYGGNITGINETNIFDPKASTWTQVTGMNSIRWYPTSTTLSDGRVLALAGLIETTADTHATIPEVYDPDTNTWTELTGIDQELMIYPYNHLLSDGSLFMSGPLKETEILDLGAETITAGAVSYASNEGTSAAMYRPGKILKSGGAALLADPAVDTAQTIDMAAGGPAWSATGDMVWTRRFHDTVLLPDGKVLIVGGTIFAALELECAVHSAEMWDPDTGVFTEMASTVDPRMYHSTSLLLPDGRVLSAGGENVGGGQSKSAEIYSPPYLFKGPRPVIDVAPQIANYGQSFRITTQGATSIASVVFMRPGSVTHNIDMSQSYIPLDFTQVGSSLDVNAPDSPNQAPPGYYMIFLVDQNGVPSVAEFMKLVDAPKDWEDCISGSSKVTVQPRASICFNPVVGALDSSLLNVGQCKNLNMIYNSDTSGSGTTTTIQVMSCVEQTMDTINCNPIGGRTLTGATIRGELYEKGSGLVYLNGTHDPASGETPRVLLHCNG